MKSTFRHYAPVAVLLAVILLASTLLSLWVGGGNAPHTDQVLATTYPLYLAAQNIVDGTDRVTLTLLSGAGSGCLHDYQLSPSDRLALAQAQLVLTNGAGGEDFLDGLVEPARVVNTAEEIDLICTHHHHQGEHHHQQEYNQHLWVSPTRYRKQVLAVMEALIAFDGENAALYRENAANYLIGVEAQWQQMQAAALTGRPCVLFHDSLTYLAADLGLDVKMTLTFDGDSGLAVSDLAQVERLATQYPDLLLIYDTQYPIRYGGVDNLVPSRQVLALETAVVGAGKPTDWLDAMARNSQKLQNLTGGDAP